MQVKIIFGQTIWHIFPHYFWFLNVTLSDLIQLHLKTQSLQFFVQYMYPNKVYFYVLIICEISFPILTPFFRYIGLYKPCFAACLTIFIQLEAKCSYHGHVWTVMSKSNMDMLLFVFSCNQAALWMVQSVHLSVCLSVTPFWICSHGRIIMKFLYQWQKWRSCIRSR